MAGERITDLAAATLPLDGSELVEISQLSATVKITGTTISALASDNSFNDSGAGFITAGFAVADRVNVVGFTGNVVNNIRVGTITALAAGKMTIGGTDGDVIVDDAAGESVTIAKWTSRRVESSELGLGGGGGAIEIEDEGVSVDAAVTKINFTGAGVTATQTAPGEVDVAISGGGGGGGGLWAWHLEWSPIHNEPPATNYATLDTRNNRPVLDFDTTTQEAAIFTGILPSDYAGGGVTITLFCSLTSATSGTVGWDVAFERTEAGVDDIDSDSFATAQTVTAVTVPGTSGMVLKMTVNVSNGANMDNIAAGDLFRLRVRRDVANDTATGDAELLRVAMVEQ